MSLLEKVKHVGELSVPRRTVIHGVRGIGKTTLAAQFPQPVIIPTEDGFRDLPFNVFAFPICHNWNSVLQSAWDLQTEKHDFKTAILDTVDWAERLCWRHVCESAGKDSIADFGFGKGYAHSATQFDILLRVLNTLRLDKGMEIVILGHSKARKFEDPMNGPYDRWTMRLHEQVCDMVEEWADEVLFANYETFARKEGEGVDSMRIGVGTGARLLYTTERPSHRAKNRLSLPEKIPLTFADYNAARKEGYSKQGRQDNF